VERGCATVEDTLIKIDIDAQRQRAVGWSDLLDAFALLIPFAAENRDEPQKHVMSIFSAPGDRIKVWADEL
jgi:hypothetical protein